MLRCSLPVMLILLGTLLFRLECAHAQSGSAPPPANPIAQAGVPATAPPGLDAMAIPLNPNAPVINNTNNPLSVTRKVIASSRTNSPSSTTGSISVPDDGLTAPISSTPRSVRTAIYQPDVDKGGVVQVGILGRRSDSAESAAGARLAASPRLEMLVESAKEVIPGKPFTYVIHVQNTGPATATAVRVTDHLPPGCRLSGAEPQPGRAENCLTWDLGNLSPGTERQLKLEVVPGEMTGEFQISPSVSFGTTTNVRVAAMQPPLELHLTYPEIALPGETVTFRIQVTNKSMTPQMHVLIRAKLPAGLHFPHLNRGNEIETDAVLAAGETKTLPLELIAGDAGANVLSVTARTNGVPTVESRGLVNIGAKALIPVTALRPASGSGLQVEINNLSKEVAIDSIVVYEVKLTNSSGLPQTGVRLLAEFSEGSEPDQADGPVTSTQTPHGVVFETLPRIGPSESVVFHVRARAKRAGVQQLRVEVNADHLAQPITPESNTWVTPSRSR